MAEDDCAARADGLENSDVSQLSSYGYVDGDMDFKKRLNRPTSGIFFHLFPH